MNILAVDTTGEALSLALQANGKIYRHQRLGRAPHDETLLRGIAALLRRGGLKPSDLDAIAAASGPGRFTGIRIGMAYAAVAAAELKIPALAVSRFEGVAFKVPGERLCVVLPGHRDERYYQLFTRKATSPKPASAPVWVSAQDWPRVKTALESRDMLIAEISPAAADLLEPAALYLARNRIPKFEPLYLKPAGYESKRDKAGRPR